jgi:hypothetical protein
MRNHTTASKTTLPIAGRPARLPIRRALSTLRAQRLEVGRILGAPRLQPKLTIGPVDDVFEREADRVADEVTRMPAVEAQSGEPVQRMCPECEEDAVQRQEQLQLQPIEEEEEDLQMQRQEDEEEDEILMPKADGRSCCQGEQPDYVERVQRVREHSGGRPLSREERSYFEPRFDRDFSGVRLHDNPLADTAARSVSARAYTLGSDVVFRSGAYRPGTTDGQHLLAHELTHVLQQGGGGPDRAEQESDDQ